MSGEVLAIQLALAVSASVTRSRRRMPLRELDSPATAVAMT